MKTEAQEGWLRSMRKRHVLCSSVGLLASDFHTAQVLFIVRDNWKTRTCHCFSLGKAASGAEMACGFVS